MTFDWFTLLAQLFNFALLLLLLRHFLYRPVLATMAEREALATSALEDARRSREEAEEERRSLAALHAREEGERDARRAEFARDLERLREEQMGSVLREVANLRRTTLQALGREVDSTLVKLRTNIGATVLDEVRQTLEWLANEDLEKQAVRRFLDRLRELPEDELQELAESAGANGVRLITAHRLDEPTRREVERVVARTLQVREVRFGQDENLVLGAVVEAGSMRLDGSAAARLATLSERFADTLAEPGRTDPGAPA